MTSPSSSEILNIANEGKQQDGTESRAGEEFRMQNVGGEKIWTLLLSIRSKPLVDLLSQFLERL
jgi:hypothetical protein